MLFPTARSTSGYLYLFVIFLGLGCAHDGSNDPPEKCYSDQSAGLPFLTATTTPVPTSRPAYTRLQRRILAVQDATCTVPPQPANGIRKTHKQYCSWSDYDKECNLAEGQAFFPGIVMNYSCDPGYKLSGNPNVLCDRFGNWSQIPVCIEVKCDSLSSASTTGKCFRHGRWVSCDSPGLLGTRARLSCRSGYKPATTSTQNQGDNVECKVNGKWEPDPIKCVPVCGRVTNGTRDFPWYASVYEEWSDESDDKALLCRATIIQTNLLLTGAHCVFDESTNRTRNPRKLFVLAGQTIEDWDHPLHDPDIVKKIAVKNVYMNCDFWSVDGNSASDIALLELKKPFEFSSSIAPACLDDSGNNEHILEPGAYGSIADTGTSVERGYSTRPLNVKILSIKTVPYLPYDECKSSGDVAWPESLTSDKFCAGDSNRSSICVQGTGGGLMFERNGLWYVMGIVSRLGIISFQGGKVTCNYLAIYTNVSDYTAWIQDVIFNLELYKSHPPCDRDWSLAPTTTTEPTTTKFSSNDRIFPSTEDMFCSAPPQPANGEWRFQQSTCTNNPDCRTVQGTPLRPGSQLLYSCNPGYKVNGTDAVYCGFTGEWSAIPVCIEIKCEPLNSESRTATCSGRYGEHVSCDSPVPPGTWARVSCPTAYKVESTFATTQREVVQCRENGQWLPEPIKCSPVCGIAITHQKPLVINGTAANIGDFPWHASLYRQANSRRLGVRKDFICGATIIQTNFLLTAAHCVYDEVTRTTEDPKKLFVSTGNIFQQYDSPLHNPVTVRKSAVKNVYRPCDYYGLRGNYVSDIALLELQEPFKLSGILLPACLDVSGYTDQILEPGAYGRVAGFGRTDTGAYSGVLQTLELPYISYNQCKNSTRSSENDVFISNDKFCAGFTTGSAVCEGDSGGGLVFKKGELWYVLGIVSVGLGVNLDDGERTCDRYSYSLYTKVADHTAWIQEVMFQVAQNGAYKTCDINL